LALLLVNINGRLGQVVLRLYAYNERQGLHRGSNIAHSEVMRSAWKTRSARFASEDVSVPHGQDAVPFAGENVSADGVAALRKLQEKPLGDDFSQPCRMISVSLTAPKPGFRFPVR
jgi:hypothetical protein